ncbi:uncharacterized protein B0H64DRAFT_15483 [Chaetomium fimeti]|uniref:Uncharacterized protein n=1 Tax=Chaetomium fimeti TaxID=1854472 RepID=A0AAE0LWS2_9PEZI|nr:hypothetical protein B0H64DRAFT_15483 [Chaetomium fimeti]
MADTKQENPKSTNTVLEPEEPEEPTLTNPPPTSFPHFMLLPAEIRAHIWTAAILNDLAVGRYEPPPPSKPARIKRGEGGGGFGRARHPLAPNKPPAPAPEPPVAAPLLHIIPFHTLPVEAPFTLAEAYLKAKYGADWAERAKEGALPAGWEPRPLAGWEEVATDRRQALIDEAKEAIEQHARSRTVLLPPGRAPDTLAQYSGGWCPRSEIVRSFAEAETAAHALGRLANRGDGCPGGGEDDGAAAAAVVGQETLLNLGKGDVCCFLNTRADGSPIGWEETLPLWGSERGPWGWRVSPSPCGQAPPRDHLGLFPGGQEWIGAVREGFGCDDEMLAGLSGLRGLLPALDQCEALAGVWHPAMCRAFRPRWNGGIVNVQQRSALCAEFQRDLKSLPHRYPQLKTIYIIDPSIKPRPLRGFLGRLRPPPTFRGRGATFYSALSWHFILGRARIQDWRDAVSDVLEPVTRSLGRPTIQVLVLACVPDDCEPEFWGSNHE